MWSCSQVIWMTWCSMVCVRCGRLFPPNRIWPQRFDISSCHCTHAHYHCYPMWLSLVSCRMCPLGLWERKWSSPSMMMMMWLRSWRVWRRDPKEGWGLLRLFADFCRCLRMCVIMIWWFLLSAGGPASRWSGSSCTWWTHGDLTCTSVTLSVTL